MDTMLPIASGEICGSCVFDGDEVDFVGALVCDGGDVGDGVVGNGVGDGVGDGVGVGIGDGVGDCVVGDGVVGDGAVGDGVGDGVGAYDGEGVGDGVVGDGVVGDGVVGDGVGGVGVGGVGVGGVGPGGVGVFGPVHVTGGVHGPVLRHAGHIAPFVHAKLEERSQPPETKWSLMAHMPEPAPVIWLFPKYL